MCDLRVGGQENNDQMKNIITKYVNYTNRWHLVPKWLYVVTYFGIWRDRNSDDMYLYRQVRLIVKSE